MNIDVKKQEKSINKGCANIPLDNISTTGLNSKLLQKRARSKVITYPLVLSLIRHNPQSSLIKAYWNTYYCNSNITVTNRNVTAKYCKNRWCLVCNRIKTAKYIKEYKPQIEQFKEKVLLTLTAGKTVSAEDLEYRINEMIKVFRKIIHSNSLRGKFKGLRKLECTGRPNNLFHPHFHILIDGLENARMIEKLWLKYFPQASEKSQDITICDDGALLEVFKYATKILDRKTSEGNFINPKSLNIIFEAMRGKRIFQPFGIKKVVLTDVDYNEEIENEILNDNDGIYSWEQEITDWLNYDTGLVLSGYKITEPIKKIVENIDTT